MNNKMRNVTQTEYSKNEMWQETGHPEKQNIVIVDDVTENLRLLSEILKERGYKVRPASSGAHALTTIRKEPPELILLDITMPGIDGYEVCEQLKADEQTRDIPVIFLSAHNEVFDRIKAFRVGGVDYITKPFNAEEVLTRVNTHIMLCAQRKALSLQNKELTVKNTLIAEQSEKLEQLAARDFLTGLLNRRGFLEIARREETRSMRSKKQFALLILDIDHFKNINDTYGHECGDEVLVRVARVIEKALGGQDTVARWGGEEFVFLLPETETDGAKHVAEKIRSAIEKISHSSGEISIQVTVTIGICYYNGSSSMEASIRSAYNALYGGKQQGRNQVVACDTPGDCQ